MVLRRAVGMEGEFTEKAALPKSVSIATQEPANKALKEPALKVSVRNREPDAKAEKASVIEFAKEKARREKKHIREEAERRKTEAAQEREEKRRQLALQNAEKLLERARAEHEETMQRLEAKKDSIDEQLDTERRRWKDAEQKLEARIREARG